MAFDAALLIIAAAAGVVEASAVTTVLLLLMTAVMRLAIPLRDWRPSVGLSTSEETTQRLFYVLVGLVIVHGIALRATGLSYRSSDSVPDTLGPSALAP